ncbi:hypothetical protein MPER_01964, partial [Moniliophthora perniciosa FA553]
GNCEAPGWKELRKAKPITGLIRELANQRDSSSATVRSSAEVTSKAHQNVASPDDPTAQEPVEGGLKTAEVHIEDVSSDRLLNEVHISPDLHQEQRKALEEVIRINEKAFGLDGRLGNYAGRVDIPMKSGAQPVSLPPFPASPANREVMDHQLDSWLKLGVIEPSKSPWGAPVFIVYRNGKKTLFKHCQEHNGSP